MMEVRCGVADRDSCDEAIDASGLGCINAGTVKPSIYAQGKADLVVAAT